MSSSSLLRIELLGRARVIFPAPAAPVSLEPSKPVSLLGYLALHEDGPHGREVLIEALWPDVEPVAGHNRLKQTLSRLRSLLGCRGDGDPGPFRAERAFIGLESGGFVTDVAEFEAAMISAGKATERTAHLAHLAQAVSLYRGELLEGLYDDWIIEDRRRLCGLYSRGLAELAEAYERLEELPQALDYALQAVALEPLDEAAHLRIMRLQMAQGRRTEAVSQYQQLERRRRCELDVAPSPEARALLEQALQMPAGDPGESPRRRPSLVPTLSEPVGGAMALNSPYYIERHTDAAFHAAISNKGSIVLVKGPRQVGKTSLLARGVQKARMIGASVVLTDLQKLNNEQFDSIQAFYIACSRSICDQLDLSAGPESLWDPSRSPNDNLERYLRREVLARKDVHILWFLDEVDRLFPCPFSTEVFSLFRSWHNERAMDPEGCWSRLTLAIAYATEAHLFIADLNQSPFNVGTRLTLEDFTLEQVAELNRRYGSPLQSLGDMAALHQWTGGCPFLVQKSVSEITARSLPLHDFIRDAEHESSPFRDHLRRLREMVAADEELATCVKAVLDESGSITPDAFYRLRAAGLLTGDTTEKAQIRSGIYATYLSRHLR